MGISVPASLLGGLARDVDVRALLDLGGFRGEPTCKRGDIQAWVPLPTLGLELVFDATKSGMRLYSVAFHSAAYPDSSEFRGKLPLGVGFGLGQAAVREALGQPEWESDFLCLDRWRVDGTWYFAKYTDEFDSLLSFSMQVPDP